MLESTMTAPVAGMETMSVTIPSGVMGGESMTVNVRGMDMAVQVPEGKVPGDTFDFMVPAAPAAPMAPVLAQPVGGVAVGGAAVVGGAADPPVVQGRPMPQGQLVGGQPPYRGPPEVPPGAPAGGEYIRMQYFGDMTCIMVVIILLLFWPAACLPCLCPCDERIVYRAPNGILYTPHGQALGGRDRP